MYALNISTAAGRNNIARFYFLLSRRNDHFSLFQKIFTNATVDFGNRCFFKDRNFYGHEFCRTVSDSCFMVYFISGSGNHESHDTCKEIFSYSLAKINERLVIKFIFTGLFLKRVVLIQITFLRYRSFEIFEWIFLLLFPKYRKINKINSCPCLMPTTTKINALPSENVIVP